MQTKLDVVKVKVRGSCETGVSVKMTELSGCLGDDEDAHEEDHEEKYPHEEPVHHLGNLLPFCYLDTCRSLLPEAVGNVLDVLHQLEIRRVR